MTRAFSIDLPLLASISRGGRIGVTDNHGGYIFYADESGDHSLTSIDATYPAFALSICAFPKSSYCSRTIPRFLKLKFKYFGHNSIVLHERDIRKQTGPFAVLSDVKLRSAFMDELSDILAETRFRIFAAVIEKHELKADLFPTNPYVISLRIVFKWPTFSSASGTKLGRHTILSLRKGARKRTANLNWSFVASRTVRMT